VKQDTLSFPPEGCKQSNTTGDPSRLLDNSTPENVPTRQSPQLYRLLQARLRCVTIYRQIAVSMAVILLIGALIGTLITRQLVLHAIPFGWVLLVSLLGIGLSIALTCAVTRIVLRPLSDLHKLVRQSKEAQTSIDIGELDSHDPQIRDLVRDLNSIIDLLAQSNHQLRALSKHAINAQEDERKRIALALHDDTGQALVMLLINLERIDKRLGEQDEELRNTITATRQMATHALDSLRHIVSGLRPAILDDLGLVPAIRWYARTNLEAAGIRLEFEAPEEDLQLDHRLNTTLFRIVQESVNNIVRHSGAKLATIRLKSAGNDVYLQIEDDGAGFAIRPDGGQIYEQGHWGLAGIQERASLVNGSVELLSEPGCGTLIQIRVPADRDGGSSIG